MRQSMQATLVDLADLGILAHDDVGKFHCTRDVALRVGECFGQEEKFDAHLGELRTQRQQAHHAHVIDVGHDEHRGDAGQVEVPGLAVCLADSGEQDADRLAIHRPGLRAAAQATGVFRILIRGVVLPARIVASLQQRATEYGHQLRQLRMHAGTVQALVVVLPEDLPVALDGLFQGVSYREARHLPVIQAVDGQIEALLKRRRPLGECHEDEAVPFGQGQGVEGKFMAVEAIAGLHRGGLQQFAL